MTPKAGRAPLDVVVAGGGVAALEAVLALHDLAGDRVAVTLIAPDPEFSLRAVSVAGPFGLGPIGALPLAAVMAEHGGRFVRDSVDGVDAHERTVRCGTGQETRYDALILAAGAQRVKTIPANVTFDGHGPGGLGTVTRAIQAGWARTVAFVVPDGYTWPLPLYELALMTAHETRDRDGVQLHLVTPESSPLEAFGPEGSADVARRLQNAGIAFHGAVVAQLAGAGRLEVGARMPLAVDRVVALPVLQGRRFAGVPTNADGFIPIDALCRVPGLPDVWAAGDGTDQPIKQGGIACQQADLVAEQIAASVGAEVDAAPHPFALRARLFDGAGEAYLRRTVGQPHGEVSDTPLWSPVVKVSGRYLAPYLDAREELAAPRIPTAESLDER